MGGHLGQGPPTGGQILEEVDGLQEGTRRGASLQGNGLEQGAQPAFKAEGQRVNVLPDKGGFITAGARDEVSRRPGEGGAVEQAERRRLDVAQGRGWRHRPVGDQLEHPSGLDQIRGEGGAVGVDLLLSRRFGGIPIVLDRMHDATQQMIVDPLVAVVDEAEEVDRHHAGFEILEPGGGIVAHQRGIVGDGLRRDGQEGEQPRGQGGERLEGGRTVAFLPQGAVTEGLGGAPEQGQAIAAIRDGQEVRQGRAVCGAEVGLKQGGQPLFFCGERFADDGFLEGRVSREDALLGGTVLEDHAQEILGFGANAGGLEGHLDGLHAIGRAGAPIAKAFQDERALGEKRVLAHEAQVVRSYAQVELGVNELEIVADRIKGHGEKALLGLEIAQLEHEEGLHRRIGEGLHQRQLHRHQREVLDALLGGEDRAVVEGGHIASFEQMEPFGSHGWWCRHRRPPSWPSTLGILGAGDTGHPMAAVSDANDKVAEKPFGHGGPHPDALLFDRGNKGVRTKSVVPRVIQEGAIEPAT